MINSNPITKYSEEMSDMMFPEIIQLYLLITNSTFVGTQFKLHAFLDLKNNRRLVCHNRRAFFFCFCFVFLEFTYL